MCIYFCRSFVVSFFYFLVCESESGRKVFCFFLFDTTVVFLFGAEHPKQWWCLFEIQDGRNRRMLRETIERRAGCHEQVLASSTSTSILNRKRYVPIGFWFLSKTGISISFLTNKEHKIPTLEKSEIGPLYDVVFSFEYNNVLVLLYKK